jgi:DNA-binding MarR family transcriptional regulator
MTEANEMKTVFTMIRKKMATINIKNIIASGLSMSQATVIQEIGHHDGISLKMLSSLVGLDNSTVSRTVNQLVEKNLVLRRTQENDRRMILINRAKKDRIW